MEKLKKLLLIAIAAIIISSPAPTKAATEDGTNYYTVQQGDSLWKIAVRFQVGLSELIAANPQFKNPALIYPDQKVYVPQTGVTAFESEVIGLTNDYRLKHNLKPLSADWQLSRVARYKSQDMRDRSYFSHSSPTYGSPFDMMKRFGITYRSAGENIAKGQTSPQAVVQAWINSTGHRANLLNPSFTHIGIGHVPEGHYWTQMFIGK